MLSRLFRGSLDYRITLTNANCENRERQYMNIEEVAYLDVSCLQLTDVKSGGFLKNCLIEECSYKSCSAGLQRLKPINKQRDTKKPCYCEQGFDECIEPDETGLFAQSLDVRGHVFDGLVQLSVVPLALRITALKLAEVPECVVVSVVLATR